MMPGNLELKDDEGNYIGDVRIENFNVWTRLEPEIASRAFNFHKWTPEMVLSGEVAVLFKLMSNGDVHYVIGDLEVKKDYVAELSS